jgi:hypothetical protein
MKLALAVIISIALPISASAETPAARPPLLARIGATIEHIATAVDQTLRNQIQSVSCPIAVALSPMSISATITPTITYRQPVGRLSPVSVTVTNASPAKKK